MHGIDGRHVPAKGRGHFFKKCSLVANQQFLGFFKSVTHRAVAQVVDVVATGLVAAKFYFNVVAHKTLPEIDDIAVVYQRHRRFVAAAFFHADNQVVEVGVHIFFQDITVGDALLYGT